MPTAQSRQIRSALMVACLLPSLVLSSCQQFLLLGPGSCADDDTCGKQAGVCTKPTVRALAHDLDELESHIERYGSVVAKQPDVWGQARMTQHRQEYETVMAPEKDLFQDTVQGSLSRSDQAYFTDTLALSAAASGTAAGVAPPNRVVVANTNTSNTVAPTTLAPLPLPDASGMLLSGPPTISRNGVGTGPNLGFAAAAKNGGIGLEPIVHLDQKSAFLNHLQELRRINEGDDTADSPGYSLNLVRIPVSVLPGKCTEVGHGAEVTMTLSPYLSEDLLPTTFRNLVLNDVVNQVGFPITEFINNSENSCYIKDSAAADLDSLLTYLDSTTENDLVLDTATLAAYRWTLSLQPLFSRPEWAWVDDLLRWQRDHPKEISMTKLMELLNAAKDRELTKPEQDKAFGILKAGGEKEGSIKSWKENSKAFFDQLKGADYQEYLKKVTDKAGSVRTAKFNSSALRAAFPVPATKSRLARMPFPPSQIISVYGDEFAYQLVLGAYRALGKEPYIYPCPGSGTVYIHLPDIQGYLQEEQAAAQKFLSEPCNLDLWHSCSPDLVAAIRSNNVDQLRFYRESFRNAVALKAGNAQQGHSVRAALAWATIVESALLTDQLAQDMKEAAVSKGCACGGHSGWNDYYFPNPSAEARQAFNEYVRCRWPIHVFALDPVTQQQNIADAFSGRREMQFAMSLAFVTGQLSARNMLNYARRIEYDFATIDINGTAVGFSHGDDTFGWRFYPRFQTPDIESNGTVLFRDLLIGGPSKDTFLNQRRLEPQMRECVAIVMMPSFVPYADLNVSSNWFKLTNPKSKLLNTADAMRLSKAIKSIQNCAANVTDASCYRDGDLERLLKKAQQLEARLPFQSAKVQVPYENTLGGFAMFNTGVTDLSPELTGWYGAPSVNPKGATTVFLVGNHFSVKQTRLVAGGQDISTSVELLSRQVLKAVIPQGVLVVTDPNTQQQFVDVQLATPYGVTQHLLIPVCAAPAAAAATPGPSISVGFVYSGLGIAPPPAPYYKPANVSVTLPTPLPNGATAVDVTLKFAAPYDSLTPIKFSALAIDTTKGTCQLPGDQFANQVLATFATAFGPEATNPPPGQITTSGGTLTYYAGTTALPAVTQTPPAVTISWVKGPSCCSK